MAYNSDINLRIGETPKTTDPAIFPDMVEIYNAIHILGQWTNAIKDQGKSGDEDTKPWDAMPFEKWFYAKAARDIERGSVVTIVGSDRFKLRDNSNPRRPRPLGDYYTVEGVINGAAGTGIPYTKTQSRGVFPLNGGVTGLAMSDAKEGELVQVGIGPAIINVEGIKFGQPVYALTAYFNEPEAFLGYWTELVNDGKLITLQEGGGYYSFPSELVLVGHGVAPDALMFYSTSGRDQPGYYINDFFELPENDHTGGGDA